MSKQLREIQARKASLVKEARSITDIAAGEDRDLNDEEVTSFDALKARIDAASTAIDREAALIAEEARLATSSAIGPIITDHRENDSMHGFVNVGEFMVAVYHAEKYGKAPDGRLLIGGGMNAAAPSSFANESAGRDGGFLVPPQFALSIRWKTNESILFGAGAGLPRGCMSGVSVITVAKESGQAMQTLNAQNLAKMISRLPAGSFGRAVWIINNDVLPELFTLTLGNYPIYLPNGLAVGGIQVLTWAQY